MPQSDLTRALEQLRQELQVGGSKDLLEAIGRAVLAMGEHLEEQSRAVSTDPETQHPVGDPEVGGV